MSDEILQEIARRVVEVAKPEKIILFGCSTREDGTQRAFKSDGKPVEFSCQLSKYCEPDTGAR